MPFIVRERKPFRNSFLFEMIKPVDQLSSLPEPEVTLVPASCCHRFHVRVLVLVSQRALWLVAHGTYLDSFVSQIC